MEEIIIFNDGLFYNKSHTKDSYKILDIPYPKKTKREYPYSYDTFIIWHNSEGTGSAVYTDRLWQWDYEKTKNLIDKHLPNKTWDKSTPKELSNFLSEYNSMNLEVIALAECCNISSGYPIWILFYKTLPA